MYTLSEHITPNITVTYGGQNVTGATSSNFRVWTEPDNTSYTPSGFSEIANGTYTFTISAPNVMGSYTLKVEVTHPILGIKGTGVANFKVEEHWATVRITSPNITTAVEDETNKFVAAPISSVAAIVFRGTYFTDIGSAVGQINMTQRLRGNKFYVVWTTGTPETVRSRMKYIADDSFEDFANPSFGFALTKTYQVSISLKYADIDLTTPNTRTTKLTPGTYSLVVRNAGLSDNKVVIDISKTG